MGSVRTLCRERLSPQLAVPRAGICVCPWCQQAWRLPLTTSRPRSDSQLPDFSSNPRGRMQGPWHGSTGHGWGEVLRTEPGSGVGGKRSLPIRILSPQVQMYSMGGKHRKPEGEPHSGPHGSRSTARDRKDVTEDANEQIPEVARDTHTSHLITTKRVALVDPGAWPHHW